MASGASLKRIVKADASHCAGVSIKVCRRLPTVTITDDAGEREDIFMQGNDAESFISEFDRLVNRAPDMLFEDALKHLAKPYVECIWR
ncbi:MAG: hypothetical protein FWF12_00270 [Betaproteobacteria bacterium]|nr:hypothetical protein [Betaproteobacteria bacterium]